MTRRTISRPPGPAQRLYLRRKALRLTLMQVATRAGISQSHLARIERRQHRATPGQIALIAEAMETVA